MLVYHSVGAAIRAKASKLHPVPLKRLVGFERFTLPPEKKTVTTFEFQLKDALAITRADGTRQVYGGEHLLIFSRGDGAADIEVSVRVAPGVVDAVR